MKSKLPVVVLVVVVVLGLVGWKAGLFKPAQTANAMLGSVFTNVDKTTSSTFSGDVSFQTYKDAADTVGEKAFSMHLDGSKKTGATVEDTASDLKFNMDITLPSGGGNITAAGEAMAVGKMLYIKVTQLPPLPFDSSTIVNQWFSLDPVQFAKDIGSPEMAAQLDTTLSKVGGPARTQYIADIGAMYTAHPFLTNIHFNGTKQVGNINARLIAFDVDKTQLASFMFAFTQYAMKDNPKAAATMKESDITDSLKTVDFKDLTVGVDPSTGMLAYVSGVMHGTDSASASNGDVTLTMQWGSYNQPTTITAPTNTKNLEMLLGPIMAASMMQAQQKAAAAKAAAGKK